MDAVVPGGWRLSARLAPNRMSDVTRPEGTAASPLDVPAPRGLFEGERLRTGKV